MFIPVCSPKDGTFLPEQCNSTAGVCWCVDEKGQEIANTRAQVQRGTRDCAAIKSKHGKNNIGKLLVN